MKFIYSGLATVAVLSLFCSSANAQTKSCCSKPEESSEVFAMLGKDAQFQSAHAAPLPFVYPSEKGKTISYKTSDGTTANAFEIKADKPTKNYLFVVHEWWGLNDYIRQEAEKLQKELGNVNVLALDLYDGKTATNAAEAGKYMGEVKTDRAVAILNGALSLAGKDARIYTLGWCFGGGWSLQASLLAGPQAAGCVMYYGQPEKDQDKLKKLSADVLFVAATKDQWINPEVVSTFEKDMKLAGKKLTVKSFEADHAFANPSNPHFSKEFAAEAHRTVLAFLRERIK